MAITASKSTNLTAPASSTYKYTLSVSFTENSSSSSTNTSSISCTASIGASKIAYSVNDGGTLAVYWHDNNTNTDTLVKSITVSSCGNGGGSNYGTKTASGTITATHKADGTLKGYAKAVFTKNKSNSYIPASGNVSTDNTDLTNIPRQATINSATNFNDEGNPTITYTNSAGTAVSSLQVCIALNTSPTSPAIAYRDIPKTGSSYTFSLTTTERNTIRNSIPNANSRNVFFFIKTVLGGETYYSYKVATCTIINNKPTIGNVSYEDINSATTSITYNNQKIIRNKSTLQITTSSVAALKGANLSNLAITINGATTNTSLSGTSQSNLVKNMGTINVSSNTTATFTLTDTRGNTTTKTMSIQVLDWVAPSATYQIYRTSNYYTESYIKVDGIYSSLGGQNTLEIKFRMKQNGTNSWGNYTILNDNVAYPFNADNEYAWDIQIVLTDRLTTTTYTLNKALDVGIPIMFYDVRKRSVGVNKFPYNSSSFEVQGPMTVNAVRVENMIVYQDYNKEVTATGHAMTHTSQTPPTIDGYTCIGHELRGWTSNYIIPTLSADGGIHLWNTTGDLTFTIYARFIYKKNT